MILAQGVTGKNVAVLGLGRSGLTAALALRAGGAEVRVWDDQAPARQAAEAQNLILEDLGARADWTQIDLLIVSPGIAHLYPKPHPVIATAQAAGVTIDNDIGLFFRSFATRAWDEFDRPAKIVAVTGSNGKSTTCALIHHILEQNGMLTQLAGNIGRGVMDLEPARSGEVIVLELSSYQTELARSLTPDIAVFTNLSPDHLDRHGGLGGYFAAKRRLFAEGGPDRAVIGIDDAEGRFLAAQLQQGRNDDSVLQVSACRKLTGAGWMVFARKGFLSEYRKGRQVAAFDLRQHAALPGAHNHQNACAAYAVCRALGLSPKNIETAMASFAGLPHRSQLVAEINQVRFVNDSKATNVESAKKALMAFANIRWICGGAEKEGGLNALQGAASAVSKAYVIGAEAVAFAAQLPCPYEICETMDVAVKAANAQAQPGDVVLLAPAAASFDQYKSFEQRGEDFVAQVAAL
ncbi:MAG: UDP-N-acetylmuramoyl-L-alanine--D-glutamate ligase [Rhodobacteraceae bacterium]|nr:UDP-N-acetylmuramoyl-L-alanine--D-glutamate ligase [Paracoccaceae bacterium]